MQLSGLWRYPIKSLAGEALRSAELTAGGIVGDRIVHVRGADGLLTGRNRHGLLTLDATTGPDNVPRIAGHPWDGPAASRIIKEHAGPDARLVAHQGPERFDILNLLVATDGAVEAFGHDIRRLRPNLLIAGVPADAEATWPGQALAIGDALIGVHSMRSRCVVTSIDPDTGQQDPSVYKRIRHVFGGQLALNCWVIRPGTIRLNDAARLVANATEPEDLGGWVVGVPYLDSEREPRPSGTWL